MLVHKTDFFRRMGCLEPDEQHEQHPGRHQEGPRGDDVSWHPAEVEHAPQDDGRRAPMDGERAPPRNDGRRPPADGERTPSRDDEWRRPNDEEARFSAHLGSRVRKDDPGPEKDAKLFSNALGGIQRAYRPGGAMAGFAMDAETAYAQRRYSVLEARKAWESLARNIMPTGTEAQLIDLFVLSGACTDSTANRVRTWLEGVENVEDLRMKHIWDFLGKMMESPANLMDVNRLLRNTSWASVVNSHP